MEPGRPAGPGGWGRQHGQLGAQGPFPRTACAGFLLAVVWLGTVQGRAWRLRSTFPAGGCAGGPGCSPCGQKAVHLQDGLTGASPTGEHRGEGLQCLGAHQGRAVGPACKPLTRLCLQSETQIRIRRVKAAMNL